MARLIDADALTDDTYIFDAWDAQIVRAWLDDQPTVVAVEAKKYEALLEMYNELRENFIDYYCSGIPNVAPYCLNKCEKCVDMYGWCKKVSDKCQGFNPAKVIVDGDEDD